MRSSNANADSSPLCAVKLKRRRGSFVVASQNTVPDWEMTATAPDLT